MKEEKKEKRKRDSGIVMYGLCKKSQRETQEALKETVGAAQGTAQLADSGLLGIKQ